MSFLSELRTRARSLFRRTAVEREMNDELRDFIERETAQLRASGLTDAEAKRRALAGFGGLDRAREGMRDERGVRFLEDLGRDFRLGARNLARRPLFLGASAVTLGLGVAVAASIFSVVSLLLLRPLDARDPGQLVAFGHNSRFLDGPSPSLSYPMLLELKQLDVFTDVFGQSNEQIGFADQGKDDARVYYGTAVTGNYFTMLGIAPAVGRFFTTAEEGRRESVVVLSHRLWMTRYAGDPSVVGRSVTMNGYPFTIIGIAPSNWHGIEHMVDAQFYYPIVMRQLLNGDSSNALESHGSFLRVLARLAPGKTLKDARLQLEALAARLAPERGLKPGEFSFLSEYENRARPVIVISQMIPAIAGTFLALGVLALAIACVNVGNLVLARTLARTGELAVRRSLGASRGRVLRQLLAESFLLGVSALVVAIPVAYGVVRWISSLKLSADIPLLIDVRLDWGVLFFAGGVAMLAGIVTGLVPAIRGSSDRGAATLREDTRGATDSRRKRRLSAIFLTGQLAFSLVLVIAGALFARSLGSVTSMDLGMDPDRVVMATVDLSLNRYGAPQAAEYFRRATEEISALPGVEVVGTITDMPMGFSQSHYRIEHVDKRPIGESPSLSVQFNDISPSTMDVLRLRILDGRAFDRFDDATAPRRALVNPPFAERMWPGETHVIGRQFKLTMDTIPFEIVGIIAAVKAEFPTETPRLQVFRPYAQTGGLKRTILARVRGTPDEVVPAMGQVLRGIDPTVAIGDLRSTHEFLHHGKAFFLYRLGSTLTLAIGVLGLLQTLVGLYGVIAYGVSQRAQEFGIRVALGAARGQLVRQVMGPAAAQIGLGSLVGIVVAALTLPAAGAILAVSPRDPLTYVLCTAGLVGLALLALYLPARRAAGAEPMRALRRD